jgi:crotonyl-CoA reductase
MTTARRTTVDDAMQHILDAILGGETSPEQVAALPMPSTYRAVTVHKDETDMFAGLP